MSDILIVFAAAAVAAPLLGRIVGWTLQVSAGGLTADYFDEDPSGE